MRLRAAIAIAAAIAVALVSSAPAAADTYRPTRHDDPPPGKCKPRDCSLREAVIAANDKPGPHTISLGKGRYKLVIPELPADPNDSSAGDLDVNGETTIKGRGPKRTAIDGQDVTRILHLQGSLNDYAVRDLTLEDGAASGPGGTSGGALITTNTGGRLTLKNVIVKDSHAAAGGGLYLPTAAVKIKHSAIRRNGATYGGGIESTAPELLVKQTTIGQNNALEGAGVDLRSADVLPQTTIAASTISRNLASAKGAGILADGNPFSGPDHPEEPSVGLVNSTVAENTAVDLQGDAGTREGAGIMADNEATVTLDNATVAHNRAGDVIEEGIGGGVYQHSGATVSWGDSLIGGNTVGHLGTVTSTHPGAQCAGTLTSLGGDLLEFQSGTACATGANVTGTNLPGVGFLADNGGPTQTAALTAESPANGLAVSCPRKDQRGEPRPEVDCDTGAFERKGP